MSNYYYQKRKVHDLQQRLDAKCAEVDYLARRMHKASCDLDETAAQLEAEYVLLAKLEQERTPAEVKPLKFELV